MKPALVDTDILSLFFKRHLLVTEWFQRYNGEHGAINLSIITYYEIVSGLKHRDAAKQLDRFLAFAAISNVLPLTEASVTLAADHYAALCRNGAPLADIDLLIAGVALANNLVMVTRNTKHFKRIEGLTLADWSTDDPAA